MPCNAVYKGMVGLRELWMHCGLPASHMNVVGANGLWDEQACPHYDSKRNYHWTGPRILWDDFEPGRPKINVKLVRKIRLCKRCGKEIRSDGANDACVCKEIGATKKQAIMFADEREKTARDDAANDLERDIQWWWEGWEQRFEEFIDRECDGYRGEW